MGGGLAFGKGERALLLALGAGPLRVGPLGVPLRVDIIWVCVYIYIFLSFFFFFFVDHYLIMLHLLQYCLCFTFWFFGHKSYGILVSQVA